MSKREPVSIYDKIRAGGAKPTTHVVLAALRACSVSKDLQSGKRIHKDLATNGCNSNICVATTLVDMYAKCGSMEDARIIFEKMPHHDVVSWNAILLGYAEKGEGEITLQLYERMKLKGCVANCVTFLAPIKAYGVLAAKEEGSQIVKGGKPVKEKCLEKGRTLHDQVKKKGYDGNIYVANTLVDMYAKCGSMTDARLVFDKMARHDVVSWNAIIMGYAVNGEGELALQIYVTMQQQKNWVPPNHITVLAALKACVSAAAKEEPKKVKGKLVKLGCLRKGRSLHIQLIKKRNLSNISVLNSLVDMYAKCGDMIEARNVFDRMEYRTVVSWNAMILGYAESGEGSTALQLYGEMHSRNCAPDSITFLAAFKACSSVGALDLGMKIQADVCNARLQNDVLLRNCLVDFYGKCGSMCEAQQIFDSVHAKGLVTWNALIAGYSRQGDTEHVFDLFDKMQHENLQPNAITFLSLLSVCSHAGLVDRGKECFHSMSSKFGIPPSLEHYTCMVDLLGRANQLDEALTMMKNMPFQPDYAIWAALLGACRKWANPEVGRFAFESLLKLDDQNAAAYALMANTCTNLAKSRTELKKYHSG